MPFQAALREMIRIGWAHILSFQSEHNNAECDSTLMSGFKILPIERTHKISKKTLIMMCDCDRIAKFASAPPGDLLIMHGICKVKARAVAKNRSCKEISYYPYKSSLIWDHKSFQWSNL